MISIAHQCGMYSSAFKIFVNCREDWAFNLGKLTNLGEGKL